MLKQLGRLSIEADGRYASDQELQFLENYLQSVEQRIEAYTKIRDHAEKIVHKTKMLSHISLGFEDEPVQQPEISNYNPDSTEQSLLFLDQLRNNMTHQDMSGMCCRDMTLVLRCSAAAMLIDDLERQRDGLLLWQETIVRAFGFKNIAETTYKIVQDVIRAYLSPEELDLMMPIMQLNFDILNS